MLLDKHCHLLISLDLNLVREGREGREGGREGGKGGREGGREGRGGKGRREGGRRK